MLFGCTAFAPTTTQLKQGRAAPQVPVANWERTPNLPQAILFLFFFFFPRTQLPPPICHSTFSQKIKSRAIITSRMGRRRQGDHLDEKHFSQVCIHPPMLAQMHICMYVWIVYGHTQTYRFCLGEFSRCCHKHVCKHW